MKALCAGVLLFLAGSHPAGADNLIWAPAKTGDNSYKFKMGVKLPLPADVTAGADVSVNANKAGQLTTLMPVDFWGRISSQSGQNTAVVRQRSFNVRSNAATGAGGLGMETTRRSIVSSRLDLQTGRSVSLQCNAYEHQCRSVTARQTARLSVTEGGPALIAEGSFSTGEGTFSNRIAFEQKVLGGVVLQGAVQNPVRAPAVSVNLRYALNW